MNLTETDFILGTTTLIILIVILMMVFVYGIFIKKKAELVLFQQKRDAVFEQELAISQVEIKEQTLNYIGQELHDDLGQKLSVARLMTNKIVFAGEHEKVEIAREINLLVGECIQDIRNLSKIYISTQVKHFGFIESLEREIFRIERLELLEVQYAVNNHDLEIGSEHSLILFRIVQECINNVLRHATSTKIDIKIIEDLYTIRIHINDYGVGFDTRMSDDGSGLKNMINRAKIIDADFKIESSVNKGTEVTITYKKQSAWKE